MKKYRFGQFTLHNDQALYHEKEVVNIPPKELGVLKMLVSNPGKLISKDQIIQEVWKSDDVADESLTRCIYTLRGILKSQEAGRYIDTVYGKGYRFISPVQSEIIEDDHINQPTPELVAVFPFRMASNELSMIIFDYIIGSGERYIDQGIEFMPAAMTVGIKDLGQSLSSLREAGAVYFLTGIEIKNENQNIIKVELIRVSTLLIVERFSVVLKDDMTINLINFNMLIGSMFDRLNEDKDKNYSRSLLKVDNDFSCITENYNNYAIFQFENFKNRDQVLNKIGDYDTSVLCNLAGSYLALAMLGIMDYEQATEMMNLITERVITLEPGNALVVSMRALMLSPSNEEGESQFHLAMILSPLSAEVYYYYACYLVRKNDFDKASKLIAMSISLKPDFFAAKLLQLVIKAVCGDIHGAIDYARTLLGNDKSCDVIANALLVVLLESANRHDEAVTTLKVVQEYRERCAFVSCVYEYTMGKNNKNNSHGLNKLTSVSKLTMPKDSVYWLPFFD